MKIPAGTKFNVAVPIEITIPHEVDIDVLSEVLAASIRSLETNVRGGYYQYALDCEWITKDFVKRLIMAYKTVDAYPGSSDDLRLQILLQKDPKEKE